jgi:hypothetical protein
MLARLFLHFILSRGITSGLNWGSRFLFSEFAPFEVAVA